ncbi:MULTISPECIES: mechanosensitive ion channel family protein [unclassified Variovorax]|uniref:mechanosensitive ion channel family protein n=1 Tax=unclassified Variovorax TaxID=663243 RepID=UPI00076BD11D|nr:MULTISPECIES: mechanosensitive ion channel family protein [unclassified Variovorax]KWT98428.1 Potassium efflux system KefA protein [Variovorax sp. WDL1]PNG49903.1 hypothetical protein CHC06_05484 [Variovorax sp. B2]PNG50775.1 hypothetical protein CHC07_05389 [Variovorax sp. B4]VTU42081.1 mechanosensitive channel MscS [Variovorax sp. PBL-H6]VTU44266.1 mechanosensitive channel MscS [Variovorax sp. SRS16]
MSIFPTLQQYATDIHLFFTGEIGRVAATVLVILAAVAAHRLNLRYVGMSTRREGSQDGLRHRVVAIKNVLFLAASLAIGTIWATKIAGVALSLAAFAGALVLSAKELIMCATGYLLFTVSRPYRVGDFVEVAGVAGRVTDVDMLCTTLAETSSAYQLTGRTVLFPNSFLLSTSVRNQSATGGFVINLLRLAVPYSADIDAYESAAVRAGDAVCAPWLGTADEHFRRIEKTDFVDLPSSRVRVLWESHDIKQHWLVIRFASPASERVNAQQAVTRLFWKELGSVPTASQD